MDENKKTTEMLTDEALKKVTGGVTIDVTDRDRACGSFDPISHSRWANEKEYEKCENCNHFSLGENGVKICHSIDYMVFIQQLEDGYYFDWESLET